MPLLEIDGVSKSFRGLKAVSSVSFAVEEKGIAALIGPNGAGKTTMFNVIAGVFPRTKARSVWTGKTSPAAARTRSATPASAAPSRSSSRSRR